MLNEDSSTKSTKQFAKEGDFNKKITIALDVMGGDLAPFSVIEGASLFLEGNSSAHFLLFGNKPEIDKIIKNYPLLLANSEIIHTETQISPEDKPSQALRSGRESSMWKAIESVKEGRVSAVVSGGNTGALMAISKILLGTLEAIDRPAITAIMPTETGEVVMLDLGANIECTSDNLFEFAIMGDAFARAVLGVENPKIGLLNIGSEDMKGRDVIKAASTMLKETDLNINFYGFVEGNDIAAGTVDVVVTDGFTGNIALKTAEGTARLCKNFMKKAFTSSFLAKIGYLLAKGAIKKLSADLDHRNYNGAMFLGLNGISIKSHGSMDGVGFACAIRTAYGLAKGDVNTQITEKLLSHQI